MASTNIIIHINSAKETIASHNVALQGQTLRIAAQDKVFYQLVDTTTNEGPESVLFHRDGNNLEITFEGSDKANVIIENYYEFAGENSNLIIGQWQDGQLYPYIPESGEANELVGILAEEMTSPQVLGSESVSAGFAFFSPSWLLALVPLSVITKNWIDRNKSDGIAPIQEPATPPLNIEIQDPTPNTPLTEADRKNLSATVRLPENAKEGDVIELDTNGDGKPDASHTITKDDLNAKEVNIKLPEASIPTSGDLKVDGKLKNQDGNIVASGTKSAPIATPLSIEIKDPTPNTPLTQEDSKDGVKVRVNLPAGTKAGSTIEIDVDEDGRADITHKVSAQEVQTGVSEITISKEKLPAKNPFIVEAKLTNTDGSTSTAKDSIQTDLPPKVGTPTIKIIDPTPADGVLSETDRKEGVKVAIILPKNTKEGDIVQLDTNGDGKPDKTYTVKAEDLNKPLEIQLSPAELNLPKDAQKITINARLESNGTTGGKGSASADLLDLPPPAPKVNLLDANGNRFLKDDTTTPALGDNKKVLNGKDVQGDVFAKVSITASDVTTVKVSFDNGKTYSAPQALTPEDIKNGFVLLPVPKIALKESTSPDDFVVKAILTDKGSNDSEPGQSMPATIDTTAPDTLPADAAAKKLAITINDGDDGILSQHEIKEGVSTTISFPKDAEVGGILTISNESPKGVFTRKVILTQEMVDKGTVDIPIDARNLPADGQTVTFTATLADPWGNEGKPVSDSTILDLKTPVTPKPQILGDTNNDGILNQAEINNGVKVKVTFPSATENQRPAKVGDVVHIDTNGDGKPDATHEIANENELKNGVEIAIPKDKVIPVDGKLNVIATLVDSVGDKSEAGKAHIATDVVGIKAPDVRINDSKPDLANDGYLNQAAIKKGATVTVYLDKTEVKAGDTLKIDFNNDGTIDYEKVLTPDDLQADNPAVTAPIDPQFLKTDGTLTVSAQVFDRAGNPGVKKTDSTTIDTSLPNKGDSPSVVIVADNGSGGDATTNNDGFINKAEFDGADIANKGADIKVSFNAVKVGNTLDGEVSNGTTTVSLQDVANKDLITITQADIDQGYKIINTQDIGLPEIADGNKLTSKIQIKDKAGNLSGFGEDSATVDISDLSKGAKITIASDVDNDGKLNKSELVNGVSVALTLPENAKAGDVVIVSLSGNPDQLYTVKPDDSPKKPITLTFNNIPTNGADVIAKAKITDAAGNSADFTPDSAIVVTDATTVSIINDKNKDGFINTKEAKEPLIALVGLPEGTKAGDKLLLSVDGKTPSEITVTADMAAKGVAEIAFTKPADEGAFTVTAEVKDASNNPVGEKGSTKAILDTSDLTTGLKVEITTDKPTTAKPDGDGFIDQDELTASGDKVEVKVTLPNGAIAGNTLTLSVNGVETEITLTPEMITAKAYSGKFTPPVDGKDFEVTAKVSDAAENISDTVSDKATMLLGKPGIPTLHLLEDANGDNILNKDEFKYTSILEVGIPKGVKEGDVLHIDKNGDGTLEEIPVTAADISAGKMNIPDFVVKDAGATIEAHFTNTAGTAGEKASLSYTVDQTAPTAPTVTVQDPNNDGVLNADELKKPITAKITPPADTKPGDKLEIDFDGDGKPDVVYDNLTPEQIQNGVVVTIPKDAIPASGPLPISATITDQAGNKGVPGTDTATTVDSALPSGRVNITFTNDANQDGVLNKTEKGADTTTTVSIQLSKTGIKASDVLQVDLNGDGQYTADEQRTLSDADIAAGKVDFTNQPLPAEGQEKIINARIVRNGNPGVEDTAKLKVDTIADAAQPTVTINDGGDGYINIAEKDKPTATITLPEGSKPGDILTVNIGGEEIKKPLTQADIDGKTLDFPIPYNQIKDDAQIKVTATVTDKDGNISPEGTDTTTVDLSRPNLGNAPVVTIKADANDDGFINLQEKPVGDAEIQVAFDKDKVKVGNTITVTGFDGESKTITISDADKANGFISTTLSKMPADGAEFVVKAVIADKAGNQSDEGSDKATLDYSDLNAGWDAANAIVINEDKDNNGILNSAEIQAAPNITATVKIPQNAKVGDTLTVNATGNNKQIITLSDADIAAKEKVVTFPNKPQNGVKFEATAQFSDPAGNQSAVTKDAATASLDAPDAPSVTLLADTNNDGYINKAEKDAATDGLKAQIGLPEGTVAGDIVHYTLNDGTAQQHIVTAQEATAKQVQLPIAWPTTEDAPVKVEAWIEDMDTNNLSPKGRDSATVDTSDLTGLTINIDTDKDNNEWIGKNELGESSNTIQVTVSLPAGAKEGDVLTVNASGNSITSHTVTAGDIAKKAVGFELQPTANNSEFKVTAVLKDVAGNTSNTATDKAMIATTPPAAVKITVPTDTDADGTVNQTELAKEGKVKVHITLPNDTAVGAEVRDAKVGDVLKVDTTGNGVYDQEITLTAEDIQNGVNLDLAKNDDGTVTVKAILSDPAGNTSAPTTQAVIIDTTPPAAKPTITKVLDDVENPNNATETVPNGGKTNDTQPQVVGQLSEALQTGEKVAIYDGKIFLGYATINGTDFTFNDPRTLVDKQTVNYIAKAEDDHKNESAPSDTYTITVDESKPFVESVTMSDNALKHGDESTVTVTFSEKVQGFTKEDVTMPNGTLGDFSTNDGGITWTATFKPTQGATPDVGGVTALANSIQIAEGSYTGELGNKGAGFNKANAYSVDTQLKPVNIELVTDTAGDNNTDGITYQPQLKISGFAENVQYQVSFDGGKTYTPLKEMSTNGEALVNLPKDAIYKAGDIVVRQSDKADEAGNELLSKNTQEISLDRVKPTFVDPTEGKSAAAIRNDEVFDHMVEKQGTNTDYANQNAYYLEQEVMGRAIADDDGVNISYFENVAAGQTLTTIKAEDINGTNNSGVHSFRVTDSNNTGWYQIDNQGRLSLTEAGAASAMNKHGTGIDATSLTIEVMDVAGNTNSKTINLSVKENISLRQLQDDGLSPTQAVNFSHGKTNQDDSNIKTSQGADKVLVGYDRDGNSLPNNGADPYYVGTMNNGNFVRGIGAVDLGAGNDIFILRGQDGNYTEAEKTNGKGGAIRSVFSGSRTLGGEGDDLIVYKGLIDGGGTKLVSAMIHGEQGDDTIILHEDGHAYGYSVQVGTIFAGSGSDNVGIFGNAISNTVINLGHTELLNYDKTVNDWYNGTDTGGDLASDKNRLHISGFLRESAVDGGIGADHVTINDGVRGGRIDLRDGDDTLIVNGEITSTIFTIGIIPVTLESKIDMGAGNDVLQATSIRNNTEINMGAGDDQVSISKQLGIGIGSPKIDLGAGDDTFTYGGSDSTTDAGTRIAAGSGFDTLILNSTNVDDVRVGGVNNETTVMNTWMAKGFEKVVLKNVAIFDLGTEEYVNDSTRDGAMKIVHGGTGDIKEVVVDLGAYNFNSDATAVINGDTSKINLEGWSKVNSQSEGGITYDVYQHASGSGADDYVWIQQGITII